MSDIRVWIADLVDIHPADPELSMIATNQPVVSKLDHDAAMKVLRDAILDIWHGHLLCEEHGQLGYWKDGKWKSLGVSIAPKG